MNALNRIIRIAIHEFRIMTSRLSVLMVLGGGIFLYGWMYNYMYAPNVVREIPIEVVDECTTDLSRRYIMMLDATPQVRVVANHLGWISAKESMRSNRIEGIVYIPADFDIRIGRGEESVISIYSTTKAFLFYAGIQEAASNVLLALNEDIRPQQMIFLPSDDVQDIVETSSIQIIGRTLYNITDGYGTYLIPAVLIIIIFQTMMMVISMLCGKEYEQHMQTVYPLVDKNLSWTNMICLVLGKGMVYVGLYVLFSIFLLGFLPLAFGLPHEAGWWEMIVLMIPYLWSTCFFSLACSFFFKDSDSPLLLIAFFSVGLIFLSGISYPLELMPWGWKVIHHCLPATVGTLAYVKLNSMNAGLVGIFPQWITLWIQGIVYLAFACMAYRLRLMKFLKCQHLSRKTC